MTKLEEVARAIYAKRNGPGATPWSIRPKAHKAPYLDDARAAIEAMRRPTEAMKEAAFEAHDKSLSSLHVGTSAVEPILNAMIDAILSEGEANTLANNARVG